MIEMRRRDEGHKAVEDKKEVYIYIYGYRYIAIDIYIYIWEITIACIVVYKLNLLTMCNFKGRKLELITIHTIPVQCDRIESAALPILGFLTTFLPPLPKKCL